MASQSTSAQSLTSLVSGRTTLDLPFMQKLTGTIETRLKAVEVKDIDLSEVVEQVRGLGLDRINEVLTPAINSVKRIQERGFLIARSPTANTLVVGAALAFEIPDADEQATFTPSPYVLLSREDNAADFAVARTIFFDRFTGAFACQIVSVEGDQGPHNDWMINAVAGSTTAMVTMTEQVSALHGQTEEKAGEAVTAASLAASYAKVVKPTWDELEPEAGLIASQGAEVLNDDGEHIDPVSGDPVPNEGDYAWSVSPPGWTWIAKTGVRQLQEAVGAAVAATEAARDISAGHANDAVTGSEAFVVSTALAIQARDLLEGINFVRTNGYAAADGRGRANYREETTPGLVLPGDKITYTGRRLTLAEDYVNPQMFGVVGNYEADDDDAFAEAYAYASLKRKILRFPPGTHIGLSRSHDLPENLRVDGPGSPDACGWFPSLGDSQKMRPGMKHLMTGASVIMKGAATKTYVTSRSTDYKSWTYGLSYLHLRPLYWDGVGIMGDSNVYTAAGAQTTGVNDNRANYDVGLVYRGPLARLSRVNYFGRWNKLGLIIHSQQDLENTDSDYCWSLDSDHYGIGLLAGDVLDNQGLTGFRATGSFYNAGDHHHYPSGNYANRVLVIDGNNTADGATGIRAHRFEGNWRTRSNVVSDLRLCDQIQIKGPVEFPAIAGVAGADSAGKFVGNSLTGEVHFELGAGYTSAGGTDDFMASVAGPVHSVGGGAGRRGLQVARAGKVARMFVNGIGDSVIQLGRNAASPSEGWSLLRDDDQNDELQFRFNNLGGVGFLGTERRMYSRNGYGLNNATGPVIFSRSGGSPEGVEAYPVGSVCMVTNSVHTMYVKTSGTGNVGWREVALI